MNFIRGPSQTATPLNAATTTQRIAIATPTAAQRPGFFRAGAATGIVAAVFPDDSFREQVQAYAARLAANAPMGMTNSKRLLVESMENSLATQLKRELTLIRQCFQSEDVREGMLAFAEKRQPVFRGR